MSLTIRSGPRALRGGVAIRDLARGILLGCGILYSVLYVVANDVVAATIYQGYDRTSQAISELSSTGSPSRAFLTALMPVFNILLIGFGLGVLQSAKGGRALRVLGGLLIAQGLTAFLWALGPMSQREAIATAGGTWRDDLHVVLSALSILFILAQMASGALAFGRAFRWYSYASIVIFVAFAAATGALSPRLAAGLPTPWLGVVERVMLGAWLLWMAVLAVVLVRRQRGRGPDVGRAGA